MIRIVGTLFVALWLQTPAQAQVTSTAVQHVTVVDVTDGTSHADQTVVVTGTLITAMGPTDSVRVPPGAVVVDAEGGYLVPGLWDMHVHTFNNNDDQPPNTWTFPLYLASGVTGVRDMWVKPGESSRRLQSWREDLQAGTFIGPRFGHVGTLVDGAPPVQPGAEVVTTAVEARAYVADLKKAGIDFVKVYSRITPEVYHALVAEAQRVGLYVAGHGPHAISSFDVARAGQRSIEHLTGVHETCSSQEDSLRAGGVIAYDDPRAVVSTFDAQKCGRLYREFAAQGTWQVPTLITNRIWEKAASIETLRQDEGLVYTPVWEAAEWAWVSDFLAYSAPEELDAFDDLYRLEQQIVGAMHQAGVPLLAGTDFGNPYIYPGFSLIDELEELVEAGLSPLAALQTATLNPARYFERTEDLGTVDVGKLADLVLLDANPLSDIGNLRGIRAVVANGRFFAKSELDRMKSEVLVSHYREALVIPQPLDPQVLEDAALRRFMGTYQRAGRDAQAEVTVEQAGLGVDFGGWFDQIEPIGGSAFRVKGSNILYVFHTDRDGEVWGFEVNDGSGVVVFQIVEPQPE